MDNAIYIVFSSTPTMMGAGIRLVTRNQYNHVSLSLERDIRKMYSFARYHWSIPLYGGFVTESILRYHSFSGDPRVKVCRVSMDEARMTYLQNYLRRLWEERDTYIYNTPEALASLVHCRTMIPKAYTCATFVGEVLERFHLVEGRVSPTIRGLEELLEDYVVYEGAPPKITRQEEWGDDHFPRETTRRYAVYTTARHFGRLAKRVVRGSA